MYFTCTLGEAAILNERYPTPFRTVRRLLDHNAQFYGQNAAVGFFNPSGDDENTGYDLYDFKSLRTTALHTAASLELSWCGEEGNYAVALVGQSTKVFFFAWLGLVALGYEVLLLSPDLEPKAIAHLCKECNTSVLVYDPTYQSSVASVEKAASDAGIEFRPYRLPDADHFDSRPETPAWHPNWEISEEKVAYYHHSSGTTGLPKLLPVSHKMAIGVLPGLQTSPPLDACFSTTPMYHGGPADCFRAWAGLTLIWLYPGEIPITAQSIIRCVKATQAPCQKETGGTLAYFSCVPQILISLAETNEGIAMLKDFQLVGVGGAAMPEKLGNDLVQQGVGLLSRYGSSECGFLMSSHRSYDADKEWMYLRHRKEIDVVQAREHKIEKKAIDSLVFEPREDGLFELVVLSTWPALAKTNRPDGSYATADLFKPHPTIKDAWKYHSRADSQITLITGKKFDPTLFENNLRESPLLDDVLIFGTDQQFPGALLFRSGKASRMSDDQFLTSIWPLVQAKNDEYPSHAQLSKFMLRLVSDQTLKLPKSSKGTTLRAKAEELCHLEIELAYSPHELVSNGTVGKSGFDYTSSEEQLTQELLDIIKSVREDLAGISVTDDFYQKGVNSSDCIKTNSKINRLLLPPHVPSCPIDLLYNAGNVFNLTAHIMCLRKGIPIRDRSANDISEMRALVSKHSVWQPWNLPCVTNLHPSHTLESKYIYLVTGATGALGTHIVSHLSKQKSVGEIHCLIRAPSAMAAYLRLKNSLQSRQLPPAAVSSFEGTVKIRYYPCQLSEPDLGLDSKTYAELANRVTHVIHAAWPVNFSMRVQDFAEESFAGLQNLIQFAVASYRSIPPHFVFCSSTASVIRSDDHQDEIPEKVSSDTSGLSKTGYARSKWVAELICRNAHRQTPLQNRMSIVRIGQLCGDTVHGIWNATEAFPLMISSRKVTGSFPRLPSEPLMWIPFDIAARAIQEIAESPFFRKEVEQEQPSTDQSNGISSTKTGVVHLCRVYNLLSTAGVPTTDDLASWVEQLSPDTRIVTPEEWIQQLENLQGAAAAASHPALKLLGFWKSNLTGENALKVPPRLKFVTEETSKASFTFSEYKSITEQDFCKMLKWTDRSVGT